MKNRAALRLLALGLGILATGGTALAQSAACQRYRAELASLGRGGGGGDGAAAQRQRAEIARMTGYYHSIGCSSGGSLFFSPPAECGSIAQRIRSMEANYDQLASEPDAGSIALRRRQLAAAVTQACQPSREAALREERRRAEQSEERQARLERTRGAEDGADDRPRKATGGKRLVCVRACDGFFFPLNNLPDGRGGADEMCKALCPGAEAAAYSMPGGDGDIDQALSMKGKPYTQLANAFKYRKSTDSSCSCRKPGQSWVEALQGAEKMLQRHPGDVIVTAKKAEELSRPQIARAATRGRTKDRKPATTEMPAEAYASHKDEKPAATPAQPKTPVAESPTSAAAEPVKAAEPAVSQAKTGTGSADIKANAPGEGEQRKVRLVTPVVYKAPETRAQ